MIQLPMFQATELFLEKDLTSRDWYMVTLISTHDGLKKLSDKVQSLF